MKGGKETEERRGVQVRPDGRPPPTLDYNTPPAGPSSPVMPCIYWVDGDRLPVCRAGHDDARPSELSAPAGSGLVIRLRRVTAKD